MGVADNFRTFCSNLTINNRESISTRYKRITKRLNLDSWDSDSEVNHSWYVGSYGRDTAIRGFSDLDMLFQLPYRYYERYNSYQGNGQSALLQAVRDSLKKTYPSTAISGDGQVVVIHFDDGMSFEIVPAFVNKDDSFTYPDSNNGGSWRVTNPRPEIEAIATTDAQCNNNLKWLCRMARAWKTTWNVPMGGLLIDTLACSFIQKWEHRDKSFVYYDWMTRDFFKYLSTQNAEQDYWLAVGSSQRIVRKGSFEYKAKQCYNIACEAIDLEAQEYVYSARKKWQEIYGTSYR